MTLRLKLPMLSTPGITLSRWAAELRGRDILLPADFGWQPVAVNRVVHAGGVVSHYTRRAQAVVVGSIAWIDIAVGFTVVSGGGSSVFVHLEAGVINFVSASTYYPLAATAIDGATLPGHAQVVAGGGFNAIGVTKTDLTAFSVGFPREVAISGAVQIE